MIIGADAYCGGSVDCVFGSWFPAWNAKGFPGAPAKGLLGGALANELGAGFGSGGGDGVGGVGLKSKPACGGGASGEAATEVPGTVRMVVHLGHFAFLPAAESGTRSCCWQLGHKNSIDMFRCHRCVQKCKPG